MTGSGNDFVFVDGRNSAVRDFAAPETIRRLCARGTGVGADGLVILTEPDSSSADIAIRYFNADGSVAALCGNATLCTTALAVRLGAADGAGFRLGTGAGVVSARVCDALPEFDLPVIDDVHDAWPAIPAETGEARLGFARAGIPHFVIRVADVDLVEVGRRGPNVRHHASLPDGANVNFVSPDGRGGWKIRTYERGVEAETLACGTGSVASAILLRLWGEAGDDVRLRTASGSVLRVKLQRHAGGGWNASLRGEGRLVFAGELVAA
ncbi:MAG: diaminopimelate epimerase [Gemmatimonadota bacterium]|nr:diaminopimelate epimerase [Gemmatimonadota bacterium]